jgi:hypothetical protein
MMVHSDQESQRNIFIGAHAHGEPWARPAGGRARPRCGPQSLVPAAGRMRAARHPLLGRAACPQTCPGPARRPPSRPPPAGRAPARPQTNAVGFGLYMGLSVSQYFGEYAHKNNGGPIFTGNVVADNVLK